MPNFERAYTGAPWEQKYGYCRALRAGNLVFITGTTAVDPQGVVHHPGDAREQTRLCYRIIENALAQLRADRSCITRVRMFVTDIKRSAEFATAHGEYFGAQHPCLTMVEVSRLIDPAMVVEIEAEGVVIE